VTPPDEEGLAFRDQRPLAVSWASAKTGVTVRLCNVGSRRASLYEVSLSGFSFTSAAGTDPVADADVLEKPADPPPLGPGACELREKLAAVARFVKDEYSVARKPKVALAAASLLRGAELKVGEATERATKAKELGILLDSWLKLGRRLGQYEVWWRYLARRAVEAPPGESAVTGGDRNRLVAAAAKIREVRHELLEAKDPAELIRIGTARDVDTIYAQLTYLSSRYGWPDDLSRNPASVSIPPGIRGIMTVNLDLADIADLVDDETGIDDLGAEGRPAGVVLQGGRPEGEGD
jgi:hypothetical protein